MTREDLGPLTREDLGTVKTAAAKVRKLEERIKEVRQAAGLKGRGLDLSGIRSHRQGSSVEAAAERIAQLEEELQVARLEYQLAVIRLSVKLFDIDDAEARLVLRFRYVDLLSWEGVREKIGKRLYTIAGLRKIHERALQKYFPE